MIDLVKFGGKKIVYMLKMGGFEMGPNKIWIKWYTRSNFGGQKDRPDDKNGGQNRGAYLLTLKEGVPPRARNILVSAQHVF